MPKKTIEPIDDSFDNVVTAIIPKTRQEITLGNSDLVHEQDLVIPALRIANQRPGGFIHTSELIKELEKIFNTIGEDAEILDNRSDTKFSQKVRNLVSHREAPSNFIAQGFAEYDQEKHGIQITLKGRNLLESFSG